jgi:hypothetical protein
MDGPFFLANVLTESFMPDRGRSLGRRSKLQSARDADKRRKERGEKKQERKESKRESRLPERVGGGQ